jgi:hypothetical protein
MMRLFKSSKAIAVFLAIVSTYTLVYLRVIPPESAEETVRWLVGILILAIAGEDVATKMRSRESTETVTTITADSSAPGYPTDKLPPPPGIPDDIVLPSPSRSLK